MTALTPINRVFMAFEPSYWRGQLCTLGSLLRHAGAPVDVEILTRADHNLALDRVLAPVRRRHPDARITVLNLPPAELALCDGIGFRAHFKAEILFRLFYFRLSRSSGNAAYVDIDTIVHSRMTALTEAIAPDLPLTALVQGPASGPILRWQADMPRYFNSGVLLFNIERFGAEVEQRMERAIALVPEMAGVCDYLDQDALNLAFDGRWGELPHRFNHMTIDTRPFDSDGDYILHATGSRKPWLLGGRHRYTAQFLEEVTALGIAPWARQDPFWVLGRIKRHIGARLKR
jgi:lipopolysaccharide biosynthesis glycosyltransferase